jgi:hypothetical protein
MVVVCPYFLRSSIEATDSRLTRAWFGMSRGECNPIFAKTNLSNLDYAQRVPGDVEPDRRQSHAPKWTALQMRA